MSTNEELIAEARAFDTTPAEYAARLQGAHDLIERLADALAAVTPVEYPHASGDVTVIGPECIKLGELINYQGENYVPQSAPVVDDDTLRAKTDMLDALIDRYFAGEYERFNLPGTVIDWIRSQPEYQARYPQAAPEVPGFEGTRAALDGLTIRDVTE